MRFECKKFHMLVLIAASQVVMATFAACSNDDTTNPPGDAGLDSTTSRDAATDSSSGNDAGPTARTIFGVDAKNNLVRFQSTAPAAITTVAITGVPGVHGIDFRPSTGVLYALGTDSKIYTLNLTTGAATLVAGDAGALPDGGPVVTYPVSLDSAGSFGFDFNPAADRIRVHSSNGQNIRLHPANGEAVTPGPNYDGTLQYSDGGVVRILGSAYTNSLQARPATTTLFGIESDSKQLTQFANVDGGVVGGFAGATAVGALGISLDADGGAVGGFDIYGGVGGDAGDGGPAVNVPLEAYAALRVGGKTNLYRINLGTGAATSLGEIGHPEPLRGIAVQP
ncbi:DUF4394 domain-containing protein [Pendulispora albinea]|uniref:DUF4394 domain-containing protein n=1 Tax=Pendulispora albinea TaxID=2741071 RepID=A0ABZ2MBI7_9BACT